MIGIVTLHYGYNEGAILQAYALAVVLQRASGKRTEIVDHRYPRKLAIYTKYLDPRKRALATAIDNWLPLSPRGFVSSCEVDTWSYVRERYDQLVVGSDQVWRVKYVRSKFGWGIRQPDEFIGRFPNIYWPPRSLGLTKSAYGASVGDLDLGPIPRRDRKEMAERLGEFHVIGVRDNRTAEFIHSLDRALSNRIRICPDPTLLVNWDTHQARKQLEEKLQKFGIRSRNRLAAQLTSPSPFSMRLSALLANSGYVVVGPVSNNDCDQVPLADLGLSPLEWVALFEIADVCVTDRMHAFLFAMLKHCPCIVIDPALTSHAVQTRISDLAIRIGCLDNVLPYSVSPEQVLESIQGFRPRWEEIDRQIASLQEQGMRVIDEIVGAGR